MMSGSVLGYKTTLGSQAHLEPHNNIFFGALRRLPSQVFRKRIQDSKVETAEASLPSSEAVPLVKTNPTRLCSTKQSCASILKSQLRPLGASNKSPRMKMLGIRPPQCRHSVAPAPPSLSSKIKLKSKKHMMVMMMMMMNEDGRTAVWIAITVTIVFFRMTIILIIFPFVVTAVITNSSRDSHHRHLRRRHQHSQKHHV